MLIVQRKGYQSRDGLIPPSLFSCVSLCTFCPNKIFSVYIIPVKYIFYTSQLLVSKQHFENTNLSLKVEGQIGNSSNISSLVSAFF